MKYKKLFFLGLCASSAIFFMASFSHAELPLSVQSDLLKHELLTAIKAYDHAKVIEVANAMRAKKIDAGSEIYFYEARSYFALNNNQAGDKALEQYVEKAGPKGANYQTAIAMLSDRLGKREQEQRERESAATQAAEQQKKWLAFKASATPIGKIESVNTDWGYAKAVLNVAAIPDGSFLYIEISPENYHPVQLGKQTDSHITLTGIGSGAFPVGAALVASRVQAPADNAAEKLASSADRSFKNTVEGVRVVSVIPQSEAARAGLQADDIIMAYGMMKIHSVSELNAAIAARGIKNTVTEKIDRYGNPVKPSGGIGGLAGVLSGVASGDTGEYETRERPMTENELKGNKLFGGMLFGDGNKIMMVIWRNNTATHIEIKAGALDAELIDAK